MPFVCTTEPLMHSNPFGEPDLARQGMVRTILDEQPRKKVRGITINEGGSNPSKIERQEPSQGEKGKGKRPMYNKATARSQATLSETDDD
ncbi:hypothetical protein H5410_003331 [Solanum commersonii]|uniref:Uncharacterized protein n=1 Tax=Solanum commersonii TaxID=4109 RepID=A0A9J6B4D7_SOLCO|nr:hypothetical protein H5410_003331 [Solanum commersonii]